MNDSPDAAPAMIVDVERRLTAAGSSARMSPRDALALAENLSRRGFHRMLEAESASFEPVANSHG